MKRTVVRGPLYVLLVLFVAVVLLPLVWTLLTSLKTEAEATSYPPVWLPSAPSLESYRYVITNTNIPANIRNTLVVATATVLCVAVVSTLAGYAFSRFRFWGDKSLYVGLLAAVMISGATKIIPLYLLLLNLGLINSLLGLVLVYAVESTPISVWLMKSYFDTIPRELDEAAHLDGASVGRVLARIVLPLSLPGLVAVGVLTFIHASNDFIYAAVFISEPTLKTAPVGMYVFFSELGVEWTHLTAAAVLVLAPVVIAFLFVQRGFISGLAKGAVQ